MGKIGSAINISDHNSESLVKNFGLNNKIFCVNSVFRSPVRDGKVQIRDIIIQIRDKHPGSAALLPVNAEKMTVC
jgi:hypothetical protein